MWYCYVLQSLKNQRFYIGSTGNLKRRFQEHNGGRGGLYTSKNKPFKLVYYEAYQAKKDAQNAESFYKSGYGREILNGKLKNFLRRK